MATPFLYCISEPADPGKKCKIMVSLVINAGKEKECGKRKRKYWIDI